ncbi:HD5 [Hepatospora eriocheir]|uniref:HD5 n=1 Tax=Hepatospora eriocheir TaxID=1081669 RepID=A0A1X0QE78_9MICR|nr:HD5 [Hepatospora eriocheir]ORD98912.1 HD5 [Hepatospora eriocheir]
MKHNEETTIKIIDCKEEIEKIYQDKGKPKRTRRKLTPLQIDALEEIYLKNNYPKKEDFIAISNMLVIPLKNCKIWFQNRRAKQKNDFYDDYRKQTYNQDSSEMYYQFNH